MDTYEKKYNEALGRAREYWETDNDNTLDIKAKGTMEYLFPELKESEDERIRKRMIDFFTDWHRTKSHCFGISVPRILAWLEKQGEQPQGKSAVEANNEVLRNIPVIVDADKAFYNMICEYFDDGRAMDEDETNAFKKWLLNKIKRTT